MHTGRAFKHARVGPTAALGVKTHRQLARRVASNIVQLGGRFAPMGTVIGTPSLWPSKLAGGGPRWPTPRGPLGSIPKAHHAHSRSADPPSAHLLVSPKCPSLVPAPSRAWALPPKSINIGGSIPFVDQHRYERSYRLYAYAYEYKLHVLAGGLPTRAVGSVPKLSAKSVASRSAKTSAE